jgi:hypothetical protein
LVGCGTAFNGPAWQSLMGEMVPRSDLPAAIALNSMGFNIAQRRTSPRRHDRRNDRCLRRLRGERA